jgi:tetratricopeptide (TPR) repeat protein
VVALTLACALSSTARAEGPDDAAKPALTAADKARAAELFNKSADAYRQGDFALAIKLLDEAYGLDPQPVLVYNRARAAEGLGDLDGAIAGYEKFLAEEANAPDRGAIEQRVTTLKRQRDERAALVRERDAHRDEPPPAAPAPAPADHPAPEAEPARRSPLPYVVAGAGVAGLGLGAIFGILALSKKDDAVSERTQQKSMDLKSSADGLATASTVTFIVGGVLLVAGATWWLIDGGVFHKKKSQAARLGRAFSVSPAGFGVSLP